MTKMDGAPLGLSHGIKVIFAFVVLLQNANLRCVL